MQQAAFLSSVKVADTKNILQNTNLSADTNINLLLLWKHRPEYSPFKFNQFLQL